MVPEELIFAAGLNSRRIINISDKRGQSSQYLPTNFCSLVRGYMDSLLDNQDAEMGGLIITPACNATEFLYDAVKHAGIVDYLYMLDVPRRRDIEGIRFFADQLYQLACSLEEHFGVRVTRDSLLEAIVLFNSIRENLDILKQARMNGLISGLEFFNLAKMTATDDKQRVLDILKMVNETAVERVSYNSDRKKIMIIGSPLLSGDLIDCVESDGGLVFLDDLCTSSTYLGATVTTEGDLFENLASSYVQSRLCSRMETTSNRINQVKGLLEKSNPDGVIYNLSKFRVTDCYDSVMLKEELFNENGLPFTVIENENIGEIDQGVKTRIAAFMELLHERG
jgi:benzoyl-CoA reductase/2-hydroxyglutaryl-CoA dehydratase subunit BcrC/BadD/HgdB